MNKKQLTLDLKYGLGRAYIFLSTCNNINNYRMIVEKVMLRHLDYDQQSEGTRGLYFYNIISLFNDNNYFIDKLIEGLNTKYFRMHEHIVSILIQFVHKGNKDVLCALKFNYKKIYQRILKIKVKPYHHYQEHEMYNNIVHYLGSLKDVSFFNEVILDISQLCFEAQDRLHLDCLFGYNNTYYSIKKTNKILQNNNINYKVEKDKKYVNNTVVSYIDFLESFNNTNNMRKWMLEKKFSTFITYDEIKDLEYKIKNEDNTEKKTYFLRVFEYLKYRFDITFLLNELTTPNEDYREVIITVLSKYKSKKIENYAIANLNSSNDILLLLARNINLKNIDKFTNKIYSLNIEHKTDEYHFLLRDIVSIISISKLIDINLLMFIFRNQKCSCCREFVAKKIVKYEISSEIKKELLFDCNLDIAKLVEGI